MNRRCLNCRVEQPLQNFQPLRYSPDGVLVFCNRCYKVLKKNPNFWTDYRQLIVEMYGTRFGSLTQSFISYPKADRVVFLPRIRVKKYKPKHPRKPRPPRPPRIPREPVPIIIQYNDKGFEIDIHLNVFEAAKKTGFSAVDISNILDTDTPLHGFKFVLTPYGRRVLATK